MIIAATAALVVSMLLILTRGFLGPTLYDRVLAGNSFGTKAILLIAIFGYLTDRPEWVDLCIVYAAVNFIGTIAVLKFVRYRSFQLPISAGLRDPARSNGDTP